jgi:hypothetical protein
MESFMKKQKTKQALHDSEMILDWVLRDVLRQYLIDRRQENDIVYYWLLRDVYRHIYCEDFYNSMVQNSELNSLKMFS